MLSVKYRVDAQTGMYVAIANKINSHEFTARATKHMKVDAAGDWFNLRVLLQSVCWLVQNYH